MEKYRIVNIPDYAEKPFYSFTKKEAKDYLNWFLFVKEERLKILENHVSIFCPGWTIDYSKASLGCLEEWFISNVEYRAISEIEAKRYHDQISKTPLLKGVIEVPNKVLTDETVSICFDMGLYLGEVLIHHIANTKWMQSLSSTRYIDYGQPLIGKDDKSIPVNPRRIMESNARSILDKDERVSSFGVILEAVSKQFA